MTIETYEARLKRMQMRSMRRGIKEMDLILGQFARERLAGFKTPKKVVPVPAKAEVPSKELYRQAAKLESSDPAAASALYKKLSKRGGTWGKTALFARARLELERGNRGTAKKLLDLYLKRYPTALNAPDARALRRGLD